MKRIAIGLLSGVLFLSACGGPAPAANTPVMSNTAEVPASTPTVAPTEVVIPIPEVVLSNNLTEATDETGVTPTSINDLDLSVVGTDQTAKASEIVTLVGDDARNMEAWIVNWLLANGLLDNEDGTGPKTYEEAVKIVNERYEFVGNQLESGPWSIAIKEKKTKRVGYAVNRNGIPIDASLMPIGATSLEDFDIVFFDMPEGGTDQFLTNNDSVFSIIVVDENGRPIAWLNTATGEQIEVGALPQELKNLLEMEGVEHTESMIWGSEKGNILGAKVGGEWIDMREGIPIEGENGVVEARDSIFIDALSTYIYMMDEGKLIFGDEGVLSPNRMTSEDKARDKIVFHSTNLVWSGNDYFRMWEMSAGNEREHGSFISERFLLNDSQYVTRLSYRESVNDNWVSVYFWGEDLLEGEHEDFDVILKYGRK